MPNLFSNLSECFGFSQIIKSHSLSVSIARRDMSSKLPIGVATICIPVSILLISLFIFSCTSINLPKTIQELEKEEVSEIEEKNIAQSIEMKSIENPTKDFADISLKKYNSYFSNKNKKLTKQFVNVLELALLIKA